MAGPQPADLVRGSVPAIHAFVPQTKTWMPATSAGMTRVATDAFP